MDYTISPHLLWEEKQVLILCETDLDFADPPIFYCPDNLLTLLVRRTAITLPWPVGTLSTQACNQPLFRVHLTMTLTQSHTDWSRVVPSASGPNHPSQDLYSIGGNVPSSINGFLPDHRAIQHNHHRNLADGNMELYGREDKKHEKDFGVFPTWQLHLTPVEQIRCENGFWSIDLEIMLKQQQI